MSLVYAVAAEPGATETTAQTTRRPSLDGTPALHIHNNTTVIDFLAVGLLVRRLHVAFILELHERVAPRLSGLLVVDDAELLHWAVSLHLALQLAFVDRVREAPNEEGLESVLRCVLVLGGIVFLLFCRQLLGVLPLALLCNTLAPLLGNLFYDRLEVVLGTASNRPG